MRHTTALALAVLSLPGFSQLHAQQASAIDSLKRGTQVRVMRLQAGGERSQLMRGTLIRLEGDTLQLAVTPDSSVRTVLRPEHQVEWRSGRTSGVGAGAAVGFLLGAVVGGIKGAEAYEPCVPREFLDCVGDFGPLPEAVGGAALYGVIGALAGAAVGSQFGSETWTGVERRSRIAFSLRPAPLAARFGATLKF